MNLLLKLCNFDIFLIHSWVKMELFLFILLNVLIETFIEGLNLIELQLKVGYFLILFLKCLNLLIFEFNDILEMWRLNIFLVGLSWVLLVIWFEFKGVVLNGFDFECSLELWDLLVLVFKGEILLSEGEDLLF